ncbi:anaerobic ribonucleoside-triphosphate reductase activating protein [Massilioclostridium coli]|uniref:anaerobic ribonucleoside-triphosphate reductase activating protein n=1 Tax=Massilioclostridium coli TaxID=1870991 RepID=UPI002FDC3D71
MRKYDVANGVGIRSTLFVTGCRFHCKGCFNEEYQDFSAGQPWSEQAEEEFLTYLKNENIVGASILGGEPLQQDEDMLHLIRRIKQETGKTIWMWTGYRYEDLNPFQKEIIQYVDVLVDGQFVLELRNLKLKFRGSENQRIIDLNQTRKQGKLVLWDSSC